MSAERAVLIERVRATLQELAAEGVDWLPRPPAPAADAAGAADTVDPTDAPARPVGGDAEAADTPAGGLELVREELGDCRRCGLSEARQNIVFGEGDARARVVFIGEGPGADEDRTGRPFVGRAGELLTRMIEAVGWTRDEVYICNVVKCRPPGNRDPQIEEVAACKPFLERQIEAIAPSAIVTLGKPAISTLLNRNVAITRMRGIWQTWHGIDVMPTFHPAYLLRQYTRENRQAVWDDLRTVRDRIEGA